MNAKFEEWYDKKVKKINSLRALLAKEPDNSKLQYRITELEKKLFDYIVNSGKDLEQFLAYEKELND